MLAVDVDRAWLTKAFDRPGRGVLDAAEASPGTAAASRAHHGGDFDGSHLAFFFWGGGLAFWESVFFFFWGGFAYLIHFLGVFWVQCLAFWDILQVFGRFFGVGSG